MVSFATLIRGTVAATILASGGCSWFSHKPAALGDAQPAVESANMPAAAGSVPDDAVVPAASIGATAEVVPGALHPAAALAEDFYTMHARFGSSGLPGSADMNAYNAFVCPRLGALIEAARIKQGAFATAHPGEKPPLVEGDQFSSLFEGADSAKARETSVEGRQARVLMAMRNGEGPDAKTWTDTVLLLDDEGVWCIDDVEYGGSWPLANSGRLSAVLSAEF